MRQLLTRLAASLAMTPVILSAQDTLKPTIITPDGFDHALAPLDAATGLLDGLNFDLSLRSYYDSNVAQSGAPVPAGGSREDLVTKFAPTAHYRSLGREWNVFANAGVEETLYLDNSDFGGLGYHVNGGVSFNGPKLDLTASAGSSLTNGSNRYYGAIVERLENRFDLLASYPVGAKTDLSSRLTWVAGRSDDPGFTGISNDTESFSWSTSALWRYSPLLEIGPGVRYTFKSGDNQIDRQSIGPLIEASYHFSSKVALESQVGLDLVTYDDGADSSDSAVFARLGIAYRPSKQWAANLSLVRDTEEDPVVSGAFRETLAIRARIDHQIRQATLTVGAGYEMTTRESPSGSAASDDLQYLTMETALSMPLFYQKCVGSVFAKWRDQDATGSEDWDGFQMGLSLGTHF